MGGFFFYLGMDRNWVGLVLTDRGENDKAVVVAASDAVGVAVVLTSVWRLWQ